MSHSYHDEIFELKPTVPDDMLGWKEREIYCTAHAAALTRAAIFAEEADERIAALEAVAREALQDFEWLEQNQMGGARLRAAEKLRDVLGVPTLFVMRLVTLGMGPNMEKLYYSSDTDSWVTDFDRATRFTKHGKIAHEGTTDMKGTVWEKVK